VDSFVKVAVDDDRRRSDCLPADAGVLKRCFDDTCVCYATANDVTGAKKKLARIGGCGSFGREFISHTKCSMKIGKKYYAKRYTKIVCTEN
jgi:hypothetical protein